VVEVQNMLHDYLEAGTPITAGDVIAKVRAVLCESVSPVDDFIGYRKPCFGKAVSSSYFLFDSGR
jgi:hypothetical protein